MNVEVCQEIDQMIGELRNTSSTAKKIDIIKRAVSETYDIKAYLEIAYDGVPRGITSSSVKEFPFADHPDANETDIIHSIHLLKARKITGHEALRYCKTVRMKLEKYAHLLDYLIDGDIKCGINVRTLEKAIYTFTFTSYGVCLANQMKKLPNWDEGWYASRKLDGVRCLATAYSDGRVDLYSRTGKEFRTLDLVKNKIASYKLNGVHLDGEICLGGNDGDDFQGVMKEINRKNHTIQNPKFKVFDIVNFNEWTPRPPFTSPNYSDRYDRLKSLFMNDDIIEVVHHEKIKDDAHFYEWTEKAEKENWEGLMLRADKPFEAKRTNNLLKYKKFSDAEYVVVGTDTGELTINKNGTHQELLMTSVSIEHKGSIVKVGSGFSLEERREFFYDPSKIIGKTITVKYFEETKDQNGKYSLRFPTLKTIHGHRREF